VSRRKKYIYIYIYISTENLLLSEVKAKVKVPYARHKGVWSNVGKSPFIVDLGNILCRVVSFTTPVALPLGKESIGIGSWEERRTGLDSPEKGKISCA
jgi:hypothetical protein